MRDASLERKPELLAFLPVFISLLSLLPPPSDF